MWLSLGRAQVGASVNVPKERVPGELRPSLLEQPGTVHCGEKLRNCRRGISSLCSAGTAACLDILQLFCHKCHVLKSIIQQRDRAGRWFFFSSPSELYCVLNGFALFWFGFDPSLKLGWNIWRADVCDSGKKTQIPNCALNARHFKVLSSWCSCRLSWGKKINVCKFCA